MIFDSTFLIDMLLGKKETGDFIEKIEDREILKTTTISVYEVSRGIKKDNEVRKVNGLFDSLIVLNFTKRDAFQAGKIDRELKKQGITIDPEDCMIAAITILNNETLITKNTGHFGRIKGLNFKSY